MTEAQRTLDLNDPSDRAIAERFAISRAALHIVQLVDPECRAAGTLAKMVERHWREAGEPTEAAS